jgi:hypothetical protein
VWGTIKGRLLKEWVRDSVEIVVRNVSRNVVRNLVKNSVISVVRDVVSYVVRNVVRNVVRETIKGNGGSRLSLFWFRSLWQILRSPHTCDDKSWCRHLVTRALSMPCCLLGVSNLSFYIPRSLHRPFLLLLNSIAPVASGGLRSR